MADLNQQEDLRKEEDTIATRTRKYSDAGFSIYSDQPEYDKYNYCPYSGESLDEEDA